MHVINSVGRGATKRWRDLTQDVIKELSLIVTLLSKLFVALCLIKSIRIWRIWMTFLATSTTQVHVNAVYKPSVV